MAEMEIGVRGEGTGTGAGGNAIAGTNDASPIGRQPVGQWSEANVMTAVLCKQSACAQGQGVTQGATRGLTVRGREAAAVASGGTTARKTDSGGATMEGE
eukprot:SAG11_NODE_624_length_8113_cov_9.987397_2_plen_100_part_00